MNYLLEALKLETPFDRGVFLAKTYGEADASLIECGILPTKFHGERVDDDDGLDPELSAQFWLATNILQNMVCYWNAIRGQDFSKKAQEKLVFLIKNA